MTITIFQIFISIILIVVILLQMQGSGFPQAFGGGGEFYRSKRSVEKFLFWLTIVLAAIFGVISILLLIPAR